MRNTVLSADRALRTLQAFEREGQSLTVSDIAARLGVHKSTASRLAATLAARGFLERASDRDALLLGSEVGRLGLLAVSGRNLADVARKPMTELAEKTGETVTLSVRHGAEMATVAQVDSQYVIGVQNWIGRTTPLHCTSDGKVVLAFGDGALPEGRLEARTPRTVARRDRLKRELARIRKTGFATAVGELEDGLVGVAAPVLDGSDRCCAAVSVSGPAYRMAPETLPELGRASVETAKRISAYLVWSANGA